MKSTATTLLAGSMFAMTAALPAFANDSGQSMQSNTSGQSQQDQQKGQNRHQNAGGVFTGKIMSVKTIDFSNGKQYVLAKIEDSQGNTAVLNLGPKKNLTDQDANVQKGQQIQARGRSGRINDKPVLVVYNFRTSDSGQSSSAGDSAQ